MTERDSRLAPSPKSQFPDPNNNISYGYIFNPHMETRY